MRLTHVDGQGAWPFTMTIEKLDSGVWQFTVVQQVEHARHQAGSGLALIHLLNKAVRVFD